MSRDLDSIARRAAADLNAAVERAELTSSVPTASPSHRVAWVLRPAWVVAAVLFLGSAVGVAMMLTPDSSSATSTPTTLTTVVSPTTSPTTTPTTAPPTTVAPVVVPPPTEPVDTTPPSLEITSPEDGAVLTEKRVAFTGTTEPGAKVFAGRWEAEVARDGSWRLVLVLSEGANRARFVARDAAGNETEASIVVHYAPPTTTTRPELTEFSAFATFGSCAETPPYDVYYGTGEPGSTVFVTSNYGSGSVDVGEDGNWEVKVFFETAPPGTKFAVKASDEYGRKKTLEFIYTP